MTPHLLFDLDGTLTDPREGITRCLQHVLPGPPRRAASVLNPDEALESFGLP
jgi:phosphoglycolate phosphatase-like HAD superfamily hydrolase